MPCRRTNNISVELKKFWMLFHGSKAGRFLVSSILRLLESECASRLSLKVLEEVTSVCVCVCWVCWGVFSVLSEHATLPINGSPRCYRGPMKQKACVCILTA